MREHLFKAKTTDTKKWVKGQYCYINNLYVEDGEPKKHLICNGTNVFNWEVDPETVCEYTGQKDEEKNEIFENDLVVCPVVDYEGLVYKIEWDSDNCRFWATTLDDKYSESFDSFFAEHCKVIGNIHDKEEE